MSPVSAFTPRWQRLRSLPGRIPLRIKLITAVLALVAIALTAISIAGISVLRGYLLAGYDGQLQLVQGQAEHTVAIYVISPGPNPGPLQFEGGAIIWIPDGTHRPVQIAEPVRPRFPDSRTAVVLPGPKVPSSASWLAAHQGTPVTVPAQSGGDRWRVLLFRQSFQNLTGGLTSGTVIVGVNVTSVYNTIGELARIDLIVSGIVVIALAVVGVAIVRSSLRPLTDIELTAEAIAAGDLSRRVPDRDPRTEVGRLGRSLNTMLAQIESAFHARADSEAAARRSEERMRQFVADASHELRTPLTAIRGYAEYYRQLGGMGTGPPRAPARPPPPPAQAPPPPARMRAPRPRNARPAPSPPAGSSPDRTWTGSCSGSSRNRPGWACWWRTCCCSHGSTSSARSSAGRSSRDRPPAIAPRSRSSMASLAAKLRSVVVPTKAKGLRLSPIHMRRSRPKEQLTLPTNEPHYNILHTSSCRTHI